MLELNLNLSQDHFRTISKSLHTQADHGPEKTNIPQMIIIQPIATFLEVQQDALHMFLLDTIIFFRCPHLGLFKHAHVLYLYYPF